MAYKLTISPDEEGYSATDGKEVIAIALDGGAARYRRDQLGSSSRVKVRWKCTQNDFTFLKAFYRLITLMNSASFLIDLVLDDPFPVEHTVYFVPGSMKLPQVAGLMYTIEAELEVVA